MQLCLIKLAFRRSLYVFQGVWVSSWFKVQPCQLEGLLCLLSLGICKGPPHRWRGVLREDDLLLFLILNLLPWQWEQPSVLHSYSWVEFLTLSSRTVKIDNLVWSSLAALFPRAVAQGLDQTVLSGRVMTPETWRQNPRLDSREWFWFLSPQAPRRHLWSSSPSPALSVQLSRHKPWPTCAAVEGVGSVFAPRKLHINLCKCKVLQ